MAPPKPSVLVVDDDLPLGRSAVRSLASLGYAAALVETGNQALHALEHDRFDAIITDLMLPDISGMEILRVARDTKAAKITLMMSGEASFDNAVRAMQLGAQDFLQKPFDFGKIDHALRATLFDTALDPSPGSSIQGRSDELPDAAAWRAAYAPEIIGNDPALLRVLDTIRRVADVDSNVLVLGESGTGKELVARVVHRASARRNGPFVPLNCAAIPEALVESELFGYVRGAFTGANTNRIGRFQAAHKGTIFLDEIGEMHLSAQAKVLRVLQDREFTPVGDMQTHRVDVRVVAATHRDLKLQTLERRFREDLYFRLNVIPLRIPPLRERQGDLPVLVEHLLKKVNASNGRSVRGVGDDALRLFAEHRWPGNVRELENTVERLVVLKGDGVIGADDVHAIDFLPRSAEPAPLVRVTSELPGLPDHGLDLKQAIEAYEAQLIGAALKKTGGNQKRAAELLRINRTTLIEKMRRMNLRTPPMA